MAKGKPKRCYIQDMKTMRAAKRIAYERRSGKCYSDVVGLAWQEELLDRSDFVRAKKDYIASTNMDLAIRGALRTDMHLKQHVAIRSREKMVKIMKIEAALLARAAKIANKRTEGVSVHDDTKHLHSQASTATKIAQVAMQQAREWGAYA